MRMHVDFRTVPWLIAAAVVVTGVAVLAAQQPADAPEPDLPGARGESAADGESRMSMLELLGKGGYFMIPIGLCSLLGLAIIIERFVSLRRGRVIPKTFVGRLKDVMRSDSDRDRAIAYCHSDGSPIARVAAAGISKLHRDEETVEQAVEDAGANEVAKLGRNLRMLFGVAAVSPMLGLLGTVWGMIQAFQAAADKGLGQATTLATGIYEALVTTFGGLLVAIPCLIFYYYFRGKIDRLVSFMNDASMEFLEHSIRPGQAGVPEPTAVTG